MEPLRALVVDDEAPVRNLLAALLADRGWEVARASGVGEARRLIEERRPDVALVDLSLGDGSGLEVVRRLRELAPHAAAIVITGHGSIDAAVDAMRAGAFDFLEKPATAERLLPILDRARQRVRARREVADDRDELRELGQTPLLGCSPALAAVRSLIEQVARSRSATALILGESGTGKELVARAIHCGSARSKARFICVNCAALSESLVEAELFGYEKGAFTGAAEGGKVGLFEAADRGTLLLDEIGEMPLETQAKLLRVLEGRRVKRIGGVEERPVDVRVIASSNREIEKEVHRGRFRLDLFYRLNVMPIRIPPLREHPEDIPLLARYFLTELARDAGSAAAAFSAEAAEALEAYDYPGNVRELRNIVEHAVIVADGPTIERRHLLLEARSRADPEPGGICLTLPDERLETATRCLILHVLEEVGGNRRRAAQRLGINRSTLYAKLREYGAEGRRADPVEPASREGR